MSYIFKAFSGGASDVRDFKQISFLCHKKAISIDTKFANFPKLKLKYLENQKSCFNGEGLFIRVFNPSITRRRADPPMVFV